MSATPANGLVDSMDLFARMIAALFQTIGIAICIALAILVLVLAWKMYHAARLGAAADAAETRRRAKLRPVVRRS